MDFLVEGLLEVILTGYMELMALVIPEEKRPKRGKLVAILVVEILIMLVLFVVGLGLLVEGTSAFWGAFCLILFFVISVAQIFLGIIGFCRRDKDDPDVKKKK